MRKYIIYFIYILLYPVHKPITIIISILYYPFKNIYILKKTDIIATNAVITHLADKYGILDERMVQMRANWNLMTNNNGERKRSRNILGDYINNKMGVK